MSNRNKILARDINKGDPLSKGGLADGLNKLTRAFEKMEVIGKNGIKARLEWRNGSPIITIELE